MKTIDLKGSWRLVRISTGESIPAEVPGDTHSALLAAGKIPDPYFGSNELAVQWVGREDWAWERRFDVPRDMLLEDPVYLVCERIDTLADISINGSYVGRAESMFINWRFDAKPFLREGENGIRILTRSAENEAIKASRALPYPIPYTKNPVQSPYRNLVRKAQCHSGWDWGPCLMVAGIYGDIRLESAGPLRVTCVYTEQKHAMDSCTVRVFIRCEAARSGLYELSARVGDREVRRRVRLEKGTSTPRLDVVVEKPRLWWPNGYGEQPLYGLEAGTGKDTIKKRIGLRSVSLVTREDKVGLSFFFRVNGVEIFCKGANWIPADALPQRQSRDRVEQLLSSAAAAHMNMIRVWGGGQYEPDSFYDICDEKGLLVWQDMMFACSLYPSTPDFLRLVDIETRQQVMRLRDHPSIALWCGNNECLAALSWFEESKANRGLYLKDYDRLYEGVIGKAVEECDPTRSYWPSSPSAGRGDYSARWHDDSRGDMHYWSVWHERKPLSAFYEVTPRFASEFGFQSFPSVSTIRSYAGSGPLDISAPSVEHHQKQPSGNSMISEMLATMFHLPGDFENLVFLSQVQHALALKTAVEHWRRLRPVCMGTLYWQLNDTWPVCSWSSIEYGGKWKLAHYAAKRFYAPELLAGYLDGSEVEVWLVNDLARRSRGSVILETIGFDGMTRARREMEGDAPACSARKLLRVSQDELAPNPKREFLLLTYAPEGGPEFVNTLFFRDYRRCGIEKAVISHEAAESGGSFSVTLTADKPAFFVSLDVGSIAGEFSDNCITLLHGRPRRLEFFPRDKTPLESFLAELSIRHLRAAST